MHPADWLVTFLALFAAVLAAGISLRIEGVTFVPRLFLAITSALSAAIAVVATASQWMNGADNPWNAARLAPALSLHYGYSLYYPMDSGPVLSTVVGPVAFLFYWAIGFINGSPTTLILSASALNLITFAILTRQALRAATKSTGLRCIAGLSAVHLLLLYPSLQYSIFCIHADAPALFFGALGCGLFIFLNGPCSWIRAFAVGACVTASIWAKQSLAPLAFALLLIAFFRDGKSMGLRLSIACGIVFSVFSSAMIGWFGWSVLRDNMIAIQSSMDADEPVERRYLPQPRGKRNSGNRKSRHRWDIASGPIKLAAVRVACGCSFFANIHL